MSHNITVEGGTSVRLTTAGKYCDRDIVVTATGGSGTIPVIQPLEITENGTYTAPDDVDGYSPVVVNVESSGGDAYAFLNNTLTEIDSDVTYVVGYACYSRSALKKIVLTNATSLGTYAFFSCKGVKEVQLPAVTSIGTYCFRDNTSLNILYTPLVRTVSAYAFYGCTSLEEVNLPAVTTVKHTSFYKCSGMKKADIGPGVSAFEGSAFAYCSSLEAFILRRTSDCVEIASNTFSASAVSAGTCYIYVPAALLESYRAASNWSNYADQFRALEDYTVDGTVTGELDESKI